MSEVLRNCLVEIDSITEPITERDVRKRILGVKEEYVAEQNENSLPFDAEEMAFDFYESRNGESRWGTYFGPAYGGDDGSGNRVEYPSLENVSKEVVDYWTQRANSANHPICKLRYAGLVWDLSKKTTGVAPSIDMARMAIDDAIKVSKESLHEYQSSIIQKLGRALQLSISIRDESRERIAQDAIIEFENKIAEDRMLGLWGFSFDMLVENRKVRLSEDKSSSIIQALEDRLKRVADTQNEEQLDPHASEAAALRLARYYRRRQSNADVERVLLLYSNAFLKASESAAAIQASGWLQRVFTILLQYGLRVHADGVAVTLRDYAEKSRNELKGVPVDMTISKEEMDEFIEGITEGEKEIVLQRITVHFIPQKEEIKNQVLDLAKTAALTFAIGTTIVDHDGRPVAHVGGIDSDLGGNIVQMMSKNMQFSAIFLHLAIKKATEKFSISDEQWLEFILACPLFATDKQQMIRMGIKAYCESNWPVAIHMMIPQIEDGIRNLVKLTGQSTYKLGRNGAMMLKNFDELLRVGIVTEIFGEDIVHYLRGLFSDQRCWNLRNRVCHGIIPDASLNVSTADRVFHALLVISRIRLK